MRLPYADVSQYVLASEAIPEIARCYFGGDTNKAESDARIAAQDGALPVFRGTPFLHINRDRWHHDHINWSSIVDPLYFPRADLLKIYPDLWRSLQSPDNETTLIAVPEGAPDSDTAQSDAIDVDTSGSDQTDVDGLSPREKRKRKTAEKYKRWYLRSKELKSEGRLTRRSEIARRIAKEEPGTTSENIRRRLSKEYPTWPD